MANHVYKVDVFVGSSGEGQDAAIRNAVAHAAEVSESLRWFEVVETRGQLVDGRVAHFQVTIRVGRTVAGSSQP